MHLHIWTGISGSASFDPECLAALWYAKMSGAPVKFVQSNNVYVSPQRRLPCLVENETKVTGYAEIVDYLSSMGYKVGDMGPQTMASLAYMEQLSTLTWWTLFCDRDNYQKVVRPEISRAIAFPMQYNMAIYLQQVAVARSKADGIDKRTKSKKETGISKVHDEMLELAAKRQQLKTSSLETMTIYARGERLYSTCAQFCTQMSPARLLLLANAYLQSLADLPDKPLGPVFDKAPELLADLPDFEIEFEPAGSLGYTLPNWLASWTPWNPWS